MDAAVPFFDLGGMTQEVRSDVDAAWSTLLGTGHFVGGAEVDRFEEEWARYCGTAHAIGVANGTDALTLTLRALAIGAGDEVVVPANTFIATAEAVVLAGATPRFADVDPDTLLLTADGLAAAITSRTSAVIAVHLYGQTADMDAISVTAERAGLAVLEDAAQAHGASWWGRPAGSLGRAGCFSFYPGKNLGAFGDAGAVVTDDADLTERLRSLRNHGRVSGSHYRHGDIGTNSRLDSVQAAVLSAKLPRLDAWGSTHATWPSSKSRTGTPSGRGSVGSASRPRCTTRSPVIGTGPTGASRPVRCRSPKARPSGSCRCRCSRT